MERFAYFTLRIRMDGSVNLAGILERLGTGERREFDSAEMLQEQLVELSSEPNMPRVVAPDKEPTTPLSRPGGRDEDHSRTRRIP